MRAAALLSLLLVAGCAGDGVELEEYTIGDVARQRTHCAAADPVLRARSGEGLPRRGDTDRDRVERVLAQTRSELLAAHDGVDAAVVERNGQVVDQASPVSAADDYQILVTISGDALCPLAPVLWSGVPVLFFRER